MIHATVTLKSCAPYSQGRPYQVPRLEKESPDDYEKRTWRERAHVEPGTGQLFIPPLCFAKAVQTSAAFLSEQIKGKNRQTYTKHFLSGVMVTDPLMLPVTLGQVEGETVFVPADGRRGGGCRVYRTFPIIREWKGEVTYYILNPIITQDVFHRTLIESGNFIGIGRFRPERGGYYGRFKVEKFTWSDVRAA